MAVTKWTIDGAEFDYNPNWNDGDAIGVEAKAAFYEPLGSNTTYIQSDGTKSARRPLRFICNGSLKATILAKVGTVVTITDDLGATNQYFIQSAQIARAPKTQNFNRWKVELELIQR